MDHDHSYKLLFSHPEMVADLLRGFVREEWVLDSGAGYATRPECFIQSSGIVATFGKGCISRPARSLLSERVKE